MAKVTFKERYISFKIGKGYTTIKLLPGQFIFGRFKAEEELGIDGSTIYKWIQKFANDFEMISIESNNQYSIITLCNWEQYQNGEEEEVTSKEQPSNNQVTADEQPRNTNKKDNKDNKDKKERIKKTFIAPCLEDVEIYFGENGYKKESAIKAFNYYSVADWHDSKGNKILNWKQKMQAVWFKEENRVPSSKAKFVF